MKTKILLVSLYLVAAVSANPTTVQEPKTVEQLESKLTMEMDSLEQKDSISLYGDMITLEKIPVTIEPEESSAEADPLVSRIEKFLRTRKVQINLPNDGSTADYFGRALGTKEVGVKLRSLTEGASEARTKLKRIILPVLLALKLKALIILPIVITIIGLIGLKGLGAGLAALFLSGAVALKAILTPPPPYAARVSYGIVKPHEIHHDHWHRSQEEVNEPYKGWAPEYNADQYQYHEIP
ncbi:uncharacterized protein [Prorops nasuta]|uniref:uncharacterized protein n=1 Tax=Prorops nasuta TaxID=863751 RepID=UPI0034CD4B0C